MPFTDLDDMGGEGVFSASQAQEIIKIMHTINQEKAA